MIRRLRDERGVTTLEFALVCPLVFTLLFAAVFFGYYAFASAQAEDGARRAARSVSLRANTSSTSWVTDDDAVATAEKAGNIASHAGIGAPTVTLSSPSWCTSEGESVQVRTTYSIGFLSTLADLVPLVDLHSDATISRTASAVCE